AVSVRLDDEAVLEAHPSVGAVHRLEDEEHRQRDGNHHPDAAAERSAAQLEGGDRPAPLEQIASRSTRPASLARSAMQLCPNCGEENPDRFRLCGFCGTPLSQGSNAESVRKTVTILFCDLKGSTSLGEKIDPEALSEVLALYFNEMRAVIERHGGKVEKYIGDAIVAVFGLPRAHEDDALRAVRAATDMMRALERVPAYRLIAVNSDEAIVRHLDSPLVGRTKELAILNGAFESAESGQAAHIATVFGPPGAGKSRLLREFLNGIGDRAVFVHGRCLSYGEGITYWPLGEIVRGVCGI